MNLATKRRIFSLLMAIVLVVGLLPTFAFAEGSTSENANQAQISTTETSEDTAGGGTSSAADAQADSGSVSSAAANSGAGEKSTDYASASENAENSASAADGTNSSSGDTNAAEADAETLDNGEEIDPLAFAVGGAVGEVAKGVITTATAEGVSLSTMANPSGNYVAWRGTSMRTSNELSGSAIVPLYITTFDNYSSATQNSDESALTSGSEVAYCFNVDKEWPQNRTNGWYNEPGSNYYFKGYVRYNKLSDVDESQFEAATSPAGWSYSGSSSSAKGPRITNGDLRERVLSAALNGYPQDYSGFNKDANGNAILSDDAFRTLTQRAIWYYTDSFEFANYSSYTSQEKEIFQKLITTELPENLLNQLNTSTGQSILDLYTWDGNPAYDDSSDMGMLSSDGSSLTTGFTVAQFNSVLASSDPGSAISDTYASSGKGYQNLLAVSTAAISEDLEPTTLTISKETSDNNTTKAFTFNVTVKNTDGTSDLDSANVWWDNDSDTTVTPNGNGSYTVTLKSGTKVELEVFGEGINYSVTETTDSDYKSTVAVTDAESSSATTTAESATSGASVSGTVTSGTATKLAFKNLKKSDYQTIKISKQDADGQELSGASMQLLSNDESTVIDSWTSDGTNHEVDVPKNATYKLVEKAAPEGYQVATTITITVAADGTVTKDGEAVTSDAPIVMVDNAADTSTTTTVNLSKKNFAGDELPGASMQLLDSTGKVLEEWTSTTTPHAVELPKSAAGTKTEYTLHEVAAPNGYLAATDIVFTVDENGNAVKKDIDVSGPKVDVDTNLASNLITMVDNVATNIYFSKQDAGGNEVAGATIELQKQEFPYSETSWNMKETWVSDTNGVHTFTVSPGTYRLVETVVPEGYNTPAETTIEFNVTSEGKVYQAGQAVENSQDKPFVLTNTLGTTDVNISKQDSAGAELPGAQMKLTDASGTVIEQWESGTAPHKVTVNKGTAGNPAQYALHEEAAPNGYDVATDITFYVSSDGTVTQGTTKLESNAPVVMEDFALSEEHTVSLSKQDSAGNELSGATIELRDALGDVVESWVSDGSNHQVKVGPGTYTMVETAAPEGYEIATEITFTVAKDGTVTKDGETVAGNAPIVMVDNYATTSQDTNTPVPENPEDEPTNPDSEATAPEEPENGGEEVAPSEETANPEDQEAASEEAPESEEVPESEEATSTEGASETAQTGDAILPVAAVILVAAVGFVVALIARKRAGKRN